MCVWGPQAQGLWRMVQGKPKDEAEAAERARAEADAKRREDAQVWLSSALKLFTCPRLSPSIKRKSLFPLIATACAFFFECIRNSK